MSAHLKNKRIVVTRAAHQAPCLMIALEEANAQVVLFPTLEIQTAGDAAYRQTQFQALTADDIVIAVSANVLTDDVKASTHFINQATVLAVGVATQALLESCGINVDAIPDGFNSEGLLALPILADVVNKKILILCGEDSRPLLRDTLLNRKAVVEEIICYRSAAPVVSNEEKRACQSQKIDVIIATSRQGLLNLYGIFEQEKAWLLDQQLCVISDKMKQQAQELGFNNVPIVANNATKEAIVAALIKASE